MHPIPGDVWGDSIWKVCLKDEDSPSQLCCGCFPIQLIFASEFPTS